MKRKDLVKFINDHIELSLKEKREIYEKFISIVNRYDNGFRLNESELKIIGKHNYLSGLIDSYNKILEALKK